MDTENTVKRLKLAATNEQPDTDNNGNRGKEEEREKFFNLLKKKTI